MPSPPTAPLPGDPAPEVRALRRALRQQGIARREALPAEQHLRFSAMIGESLYRGFPQLATMRVAFCWPFRHEPDLRPLIQRWQQQSEDDFMALLPVVTAPATALSFRRWQVDTPMRRDSYGICTPDEGDFITPEALLIPVNAFDAKGFRLGYGAGYFDRTLMALPPATLSIGIGFELARVASTHPQTHDCPLDFIVTEAGIFPSA